MLLRTTGDEDENEDGNEFLSSPSERPPEEQLGDIQVFLTTTTQIWGAFIFIYGVSELDSKEIYGDIEILGLGLLKEQC